MMNVGLFVRLEAKPNKVHEVEALLKKGLEMVEEEPGTAAWFGIRLGPKTFGIFDTFADNSGREAHLAGRLAANLKARAGELLTEPPVIEKVDVLAAKTPEEYCMI